MLHRLASPAAVVTAVLASALGCRPLPVLDPAHGHPPAAGIRRETSFVPAPKMEGARLATDRVVKMIEADEEAMTALGGVKLGVLHVRVVDRVDPWESEWQDEMVWPGASVDAAALGATHARRLSIEAPQLFPFDCGFHRHACANPPMTRAAVARYELWRVAPERWAELPERLRPAPLPASAIRDVQPGNWVRPPPVVTVTRE